MGILDDLNRKNDPEYWLRRSLPGTREFKERQTEEMLHVERIHTDRLSDENERLRKENAAFRNEFADRVIRILVPSTDGWCGRSPLEHDIRLSSGQSHTFNFAVEAGDRACIRRDGVIDADGEEQFSGLLHVIVDREHCFVIEYDLASRKVEKVCIHHRQKGS